ncbi:MAG TPA: alanine--glyoxylate aminotransferase family protein [Candidatus Limnocylindrales bacterium]|nr:alanine--glyoxylate aminotransferase family protein [Candidatus Limnocylindrales bacterium]
MEFPPQLRIPGPTPVPDRVQQAMAAPMINHRGPEFKALLHELEEGLKWAFQTRNDLLLFPASGTGGLESAVANLVSPGERVLAVSIGAFGDRFADLAAAFGADVVRYALPWGEAADPEDLDAMLGREDEIRTVLLTHNETSTGVTNPLEPLASVVKQRGRLLVVDGVSSIGSIDLPVDDWGVDVAITASQKGWMVPPGLTMLSVSAAAWERQATSRGPRFYFDWTRARKMQAEGATFTTPAVSIMFGLCEALGMMRQEGLPAIFQRHLRIGAAFRAAVSAMNLALLADPEAASPTVTAAFLPPALQGALSKEVFRTWRERYRLVLGTGQGALSGQIFRIGHLGAVYEEDVAATVTALEHGLHDHGYVVEPGAALAAARRVLEAPEAALSA